MVQTPVGARCPDCAKLYRLPTYQVSTKYYLRAIGTGLGMAIVCGIAWGLVMGFVHFFYLNLLLALGAGYAIGEVVSLSVNRKRGKGLAAVAGIAVAISYFVSFLFHVVFISPAGLHLGLFSILYGILALALGIFVAVTRLR